MPSRATNADRDQAITALFAAQRTAAQQIAELVIVVNRQSAAIAELQQMVSSLCLTAALATTGDSPRGHQA